MRSPEEIHGSIRQNNEAVRREAAEIRQRHDRRFEAIEAESRERTALIQSRQDQFFAHNSQPIPQAHVGPVERAITGAIIAVIAVAVIVLTVLYYVALFVFSPGILVSMLIFGSLGWVGACLSSAFMAALVVIGLYAAVRNTRKTAMMYAGCCVLATGLIVAFGGLSNAEAFLRGRYDGSNMFSRTSEEIPSVSISNFSSPPVETGEQHPAAPQGASRAESSAPSAGTGTPVQAVDRTSPNSGDMPAVDRMLAAQKGTQATEDQPTKATSSVVAAVVPPTSVAANQGDTNVPVRQARSQRPIDDAGTSQVAITQPAAMPQTVTEKRDEPTGPSFDCTKARTFHEQHVCANTKLAKLDVELAAQYQAAMTSAKVPHVIRLDQGKWLRELVVCRDDACLAREYEARIEQLKKVAAGTADR